VREREREEDSRVSNVVVQEREEVGLKEKFSLLFRPLKKGLQVKWETFPDRVRKRVEEKRMCLYYGCAFLKVKNIHFDSWK